MRLETRLDLGRYTAIKADVNVRNYFEYSVYHTNGTSVPVCMCCTEEHLTTVARCSPNHVPFDLRKYTPRYLNPENWRGLCDRCGAFCSSGAPVVIDPELCRLWADELKKLEDKTFITALFNALNKGTQHCVGTLGARHDHLDGLSRAVNRLLKTKEAKQLQKYLCGLDVRYAEAQEYGPSAVSKVPAVVAFDKAILTHGMGNGATCYDNQLVAIEVPMRYGYVPRITFDLKTAVMPKHTRVIMFLLAVFRMSDIAILRYYVADDIAQLRQDMTKFTHLNENGVAERDTAGV